MLQFALDSQKVGGEAVVQRFSRVLVQAAQGAAGRLDATHWADRARGLTEQLHLPLAPQHDAPCPWKAAGTQTP